MSIWYVSLWKVTLWNVSKWIVYMWNMTMFNVSVRNVSMWNRSKRNVSNRNMLIWNVSWWNLKMWKVSILFLFSLFCFYNQSIFIPFSFPPNFFINQKWEIALCTHSTEIRQVNEQSYWYPVLQGYNFFLYIRNKHQILKLFCYYPYL